MNTRITRLHCLAVSRCNNNCVFCCNRFPEIRCRDDGGDIKIKDMFVECKKKRQIDGIVFTGGEPTLHPEIVRIINTSKGLGYKNIGLQTNGRLLSYKNLCREMLDAGLNEVNISLHSSNEKMHDALTRTKNAFKETVCGLKNMLKLKQEYQIKINVNFTVTSINYKNIPEYLKFIIAFKKIDSIVLNTMMCWGNAQIFFNRLFVTYSKTAEEVKKGLDFIGAKKRILKTSINVSPMPVCLMPGYEEFVGLQENPKKIECNELKILNRGASFIKAEQCKKCIYKKECDGIDYYYAKIRGTRELKPVLIS